MTARQYRPAHLLELSFALMLLLSVAGPAASDDLALAGDPAPLGNWRGSGRGIRSASSLSRRLTVWCPGPLSQSQEVASSLFCKPSDSRTEPGLF
jgi:hypothetical protein